MGTKEKLQYGFLTPFQHDQTATDSETPIDTENTATIAYQPNIIRVQFSYPP